MTRQHGRVASRIWSDDDFLALDANAQRLYLFLLSQSDLSHAGLVPMRLKRWAGKVNGGTVKGIRDTIKALADTRFIVADEDTEEVLIRTFVRNDGVWKQPKVMLRLREDAREIESPALRFAFAAELERLPLDELKDEPGGAHRDQPSTREVVAEIVQTILVDFRDVYPSGRVSDTPRVRAGAFPRPPSPVPLPPAPIMSAVADATNGRDERPDVDQLLDYLDIGITANDAKLPTRNQRNRDAMRLLLDRDGRTPDQIRAAIDFATTDEFWRANILSASKLREKYDQLRMSAERAGWRRPGTRRQQQQAEFWEAEMQAARDYDQQNARKEIGQ